MALRTNSHLFPFPSTAVDAVLLDLDGTLVDTLDDFVCALQAMFDALDLPGGPHTVTRTQVERLVGKGSENLVNQALALVKSREIAINTEASADYSETLRARALALYLAYYRDINGRQARVYPGVREALDRLQARGLPLACVTNKPTPYARELLQRLGLDPYFGPVIGGDALPQKKPHPAPLLEACRQLGVSPARTLMVGDSSNDAQAARSAGCPVLLVRYGYNHGEPIDAVEADGWCDSLAEVWGITGSAA